MPTSPQSPWAGVPFNPDVTQEEASPSPVWATPDAAQPPQAMNIPQMSPAPPLVPKIDLHKPLTQIFAPPPEPANPQDEITSNLKGKLEKDYEKDANPMGSPNNHPGFFGKLAHGLSHALGGDTRRQWEEQGLAKQINAEQESESLNRERNAAAGHTEAETPEVAPNAESRRKLEGAQTANEEALTAEKNDALQNPTLVVGHAHAVDKAIREGRDPAEDPVVQAYEARMQAAVKPAAPKGAEHINIVGPNGKPMVASYDPVTRQTTDAAGNVIPNPVPYEPPNYASMLPLVLSTKTATYIDPDTNLPTEKQFNPVTRTFDKPLGLSASNAYGHEAAQAGAVERSGTALIQTIQANRDKIGTVGAWIKKNGLNTPMADPTLEGIRTEIASFAALNPAMHGARGAQAMQHFEDLIGGVQQNPDATIAGIHGLIRGAAQPILGQNQGPKVGDVEGGYRFKGGNAADKNSWEKVTK